MASEAREEYQSSLNELTFNSKPHINMLTMLAEENVQYASVIVDVIEAHIMQVEAKKKLPTLYLIDSIVKNCKTAVYKTQFSKNIVKIFVHVFEQVEEKTRQSMFKLRQTWQDLFPNSKLYHIDIKVQAIDPAWPVGSASAAAKAVSASVSTGAAKTGAELQKIHVNPAFLNADRRNPPRPAEPEVSSSTDSSSKPEDDAQRELKMRKVLQQEVQMKKAALQKTKEASMPLVASAAGAVKAPPLVITRPAAVSLPPKATEVKEKVVKIEPDALINTKTGNSKVSTEMRIRKEQQILSSLKRKQESMGSQKQPSKIAATSKTQAPMRARPGRVDGTTGEGNVGRTAAVDSSSLQGRDVDLRSLPLKKRKTSSLSSEGNATSSTVVSETVPSKSHSQKFKEKRQKTDSVSAERSGALFMSEDQDMRRIFTDSRTAGEAQPEPVDVPVQTVSQIVKAGVPDYQAPPVLKAKPSVSGSVRSSGVDSSRISSFAAQVDDRMPQPVIPKNKTIYVDGRAYEVHYVHDVPVIERNGLPHRIFFVGQPRDVIIDGSVHMLAFGEKKTVIIDGHSHTLSFGGPSRELIMDGYPFRGSFGGPPIVTTVNGICHKIQLCGPPPEVKIDPEPDYELLRLTKGSQFSMGAPPVHSIHRPDFILPPAAVASFPNAPPVVSAPMPQGMVRPAIEDRLYPAYSAPAPVRKKVPDSIVINPPLQLHPARPPSSVSSLPEMPASSAPTAASAINVNDILQKLVKSGLIAGQSDATKSPKKSDAVPSAPNLNLPANVVAFRDRLATAAAPPPTLLDMTIVELSTRYEDVLTKLHPTGQQCGTCGLRFSDSEKYSKHLDWHFQLNKREKDKRAPMRSWYLVIEDWVNYEETSSEAPIKVKSEVFEAQQDKQADEQRPALDLADHVIRASSDNQCCEVCQDKFEQFYDEEEEAWKCRNAVEVGGKFFHPICCVDLDTSNLDPAEPSIGPIQDRESHALMRVQCATTKTSDDAYSLVKPEPMDTIDVR